MNFNMTYVTESLVNDIAGEIQGTWGKKTPIVCTHVKPA